MELVLLDPHPDPRGDIWLRRPVHNDQFTEVCSVGGLLRLRYDKQGIPLRGKEHGRGKNGKK